MITEREKINKEPTGEMVAWESGSTTLKQCGWCEYVWGSRRYNYCIEGTCALLEKYSFSSDKTQVKWNDKCFFSTALQSEVKSLIEGHEYSIELAKKDIEDRKKYVEILNGMYNNKDYVPPLPEHRKHDHFNIGSKVAVWHQDKWFFGEVQSGYRHHDGCVSYRLDGIGPQGPGDNENFTGFWGSGMSIPHVILTGEYLFFKKNPQIYKQWCKKAYDKEFNGKTLAIALIE